MAQTALSVWKEARIHVDVATHPLQKVRHELRLATKKKCRNHSSGILIGLPWLFYSLLTTGLTRLLLKVNFSLDN